MDTNVQMGDLLGRVDLTMDEMIGRVVVNGGVQVGKPFDVCHGHPIVDPNLRCLVVGWYLDGRNGEVGQNRVVGG